MIRQFLKDESGATAIEYGILAALVAVGLVTAVTALDVGGLFAEVKTAISGVVPKGEE